MANIKSQVKRNRQNHARHLRNQEVRSELKTRDKSAVGAAENGNAEEAEVLLRIAQKRIDMAVSKGVLAKNTAARRKSRLTRRVRALLA